MSALIRSPIQPRDDNSSSSEDENSQAPVPAATIGASESATQQLHQPLTTAESVPRCATCWFALVPCGHVRFCESCVVRVLCNVLCMDVGCPVCRADITMVMRIFLILVWQTMPKFPGDIQPNYCYVLMVRYFISSKNIKHVNDIYLYLSIM